MANSHPSIVTVCEGYPSDVDPNVRIQVHNLMRAFQTLGVTPLVVAPEKRASFTQWRNPFVQPSRRDNYENISVIRPRYMSFSSRKMPLLGSTYRWTVRSFTRSVSSAKSDIDFSPKLIYGHFLLSGGTGALSLADQFNSKAVVALGESSFSRYESHFGVDALRRLLAKFWKIVAVSENIKRRCVDRYSVDVNQIETFSNAPDTSRFFPRPKAGMRRKLGLPSDRIIVGFVGAFNENKGPQRILKAIEPRPDIGAVFIGSGPLNIRGPQVLAARPVPHNAIPDWLSAVDIYVQPVFAEGSSNSMLEAVACGLPIISSDIAANREILDSSHASLVNPANIDQLRTEIERLADDPELRASMSEAALAKARRSNINTRASQILEWLELV